MTFGKKFKISVIVNDPRILVTDDSGPILSQILPIYNTSNWKLDFFKFKVFFKFVSFIKILANFLFAIRAIEHQNCQFKMGGHPTGNDRAFRIILQPTNTVSKVVALFKKFLGQILLRY